MASSLSFKIQAPIRPSPLSKQPSNSKSSNNNNNNNKFNSDSSSSDEDEGGPSRPKKHRDELLTGFDSTGSVKKNKSIQEGPLIIASLPNKDWRKAAGTSSRNGKKGKKERYIPDSVGSMRIVGGEGGGSSGTKGLGRDEKTQGGMGTTDVINDTVVIGGLEVGGSGSSKKMIEVKEETIVKMEVEEEKVKVLSIPETEETRAIRELMSGSIDHSAEVKEDLVLYSAADDRGGPLDESDAFKRDLESRPDESTLEDYARVPVGTFGLALLRGMGWKQGTTASRSNRSGPVEAFVPTSRPALLGIGAKPLAEVLGETKSIGGAGGKGKRVDKREEMKYVPLLRKEREGGGGSLNGAVGGSGKSTPLAIESSTSTSRGGDSPPSRSREQSSRPYSSRKISRSPPPPNSTSTSSRYRERERDEDTSSGSRRRRDDDRDRDRDRSSRREGGSSREERDGGRDDRDRKRARSTSRDRGDYREKERRSDREREGNSSRDGGDRRSRDDRDRSSRDDRDNRDRDDRRRRDRDDDRDRNRDRR